jgi:hypothetical protein
MLWFKVKLAPVKSTWTADTPWGVIVDSRFDSVTSPFGKSPCPSNRSSTLALPPEQPASVRLMLENRAMANNRRAGK